MFSIFRKKYTVKTDFSALRADMHSHLLPGIDDGATDVPNSIELINGLKDLGYEKFITTPHIFWDMYKNDPVTIGEAHRKLLKEMNTLDIDIPLSAAAEYYLDDHFDMLLEEKTPLLPVKDKMVLVEFSFIAPSVNFKNQLFQMQINGYQPILAHPERYSYLINNKKIFDDLKSDGCLFQLNLLSLTGYYGKPAADLAQYLIKMNYVDLLGTDLHHLRHLEALRFSSNLMASVSSLLDSGRILNPTF